MKSVCLVWGLSCFLLTSGISDPADSRTTRTPSPDGSFVAVISSTEEKSPENRVTIVSKEKGSQAEFRSLTEFSRTRRLADRELLLGGHRFQLVLDLHQAGQWA